MSETATETKEENAEQHVPLSEDIDEELQRMYEVGAHYGLSRSRRHPSTIPYIYGTEDNMEVFDLQKTRQALHEAIDFVKQLGKEGKQLLFVTSKHEANKAIREGAQQVDQPYVTDRWIGGTITNFDNIRGRIDKLHELQNKRETGELEKYTKKEQLLLEREIERLQSKFGGIEAMESKPGAMFIIDTKEEQIATSEANQYDIPVVALCNTDCNIDNVQYPIPANDANRASVQYFTDRIVEAYEEGRREFTKEDEQEDVEQAKTMADEDEE